MHALAAFVMDSRWKAVMVAIAFAVGAFVVPPAGIVSAAAVALVALRLGPWAGLSVAALATLGLVLLALIAGRPGIGVAYGLSQWLPVLVVAQVLRQTVSLRLTVQVIIVLGLLGVLLFHAAVADTAAFWMGVMDALVRPVLSQAEVSPAELETALQQAARVMTGMVAALVVVGLILSLFLARAWQAQLYNPGGFRQEAESLDLGRAAAALALALLALGTAAGQGLALELALVVLAGFALQGIVLVHALNRLTGMHAMWLVGIYLLLLFALPQMAALLAAVGLVDSFVDFRARLARRD